MFRIESYVTPILLSYVDKYVRDFKPADAQVSLWGGGVALHNLVLKADVLQQEVALPFKLVSGRIHELLIQVPWTKIMSEPIVVTIDTIECVLSLNQPTTSSDETTTPEPPSRETHVVEAPPGYMQALVRRIVSNISLRIHHLIVKYVQDDIVLSLNVKHLAIDSAGSDWAPTFADIDQTHPVVRRLVVLDDLTLCLDRADADGKIRFYQEPLLYRCQLDLRVLTRLISANTRRVSSLTVELRSSKLAWGVTNEQLTLLLRLIRERSASIMVDAKPPTPAPKVSGSNLAMTPQLSTSSTNTAEPARSESWSEWAWSWLPTWKDREDIEETAKTPMPIPIHFTAFFDEVSVVFKVMELETKVRKRGRAVLELMANHAAVMSYICAPTTTHIRLGTRDFTLSSKGKCVCGHANFQTLNDNPTVYISKIKNDDEVSDTEWTWPEDQMADVGEFSSANIKPYTTKDTPTDDTVGPDTEDTPTQMSDHGLLEEPTPLTDEKTEGLGSFWAKMSPLIFLELSHERTPPVSDINPYDNPPMDFQYSDWVEEAMIKMVINPIEIRVDMDMLHRFSILTDIYRELPPVPVPEETMRVLTVEECEALSDNLPQRRITLEMVGWRVRILPWDHSTSERPKAPTLFLDLDMPKNVIVLNGPLYPLRVCSAACQMPEDTGVVWQGARLHITCTLTALRMAISGPNEKNSRHCGRADIKAVAHMLLNKQFFTKLESIHLGYSIKINEANVCGSAPRLMAALQIPLSLFTEKFSVALRYSSLPKDVLNDEDAVAIDVTMEDMSIRGYKTAHIITHIILLHSIRITALHEHNRSEGAQAWLFSAPDNPTTSPFLRLAVQLCLEPVPFAFEYIGVWTEPTAVAIDPLFIAWLAYRPTLRPLDTPRTSIRSASNTPFFVRRRGSTQSSSGRGASRSGSGADMIHMRTRSADSSDKTESKDKNVINQDTEAPKPQPIWSVERLQTLHERLKRMYINVELGLILAYITMTTVSALDCETIRDAIERHAVNGEKVLTVSLGRIFLFSSTISKQFWYEISHDGPTFKGKSQGPEKESFPWKMRIADLACYTLETPSKFDKHHRDRASSGLKSVMKSVCLAKPKTVLELVTSTVTLSTVTKSIQYIKPGPMPEQKKADTKFVDEKVRFFKTGMSFKPTTLKEFVRGPAARKKDTAPEENREVRSEAPKPEVTSGPIVSIGVHVHADTPPLILKLEQNQVLIVSAALHCLIHIVTLLNRPSLQSMKISSSPSSLPQRLLVRSLSEESQSQDSTLSEERSALISIYESTQMQTFDLKTFFCLQWVVSSISIVVISDEVKLAFDLEDIISTLDFQRHYNQLKVKVAAASIRHYHMSPTEEWVAEIVGGRVLEARDAMDNNFMSVTITQAQISNLPEQWKQELHPKLLEQKSGSDIMWEVYMTLADLESVIQPKLVKHIYSLLYNMVPRSFCPLKRETVTIRSDRQLPYLYLSAGGLRVLLTGDKPNKHREDTFILSLGKVTITPHPENPICRRVVNAGPDLGWLSGDSYEGRQYEVYLRHVDIRSAQFLQLVDEFTTMEMMQGVENPALKWSQSSTSPVITPLLHDVDIGCVLAPAAYKRGALVAGPAVELNLVTDCSVELSLNQLVLANELVKSVKQVVNQSHEDSNEESKWQRCPYNKIILTHTTMDSDVLSGISDTTLTLEKTVSYTPDTFRSVAVDSGIGSYSPGSQSKLGRDDTTKKTVSIMSFDNTNDPQDFVEVFVTMGTVAITLYAVLDGTDLVEALRPPDKWVKPADSGPDTSTQTPTTARSEPTMTKSAMNKVDDEENKSLASSIKQLSENDSPSIKSRSVTETDRDTGGIGRTRLDIPLESQARGGEGNLPLIHLTLSQPNLYYWRNKSQKNIQISLFDAWLCLGAGVNHNLWHCVLVSTARGVIDPVTDIPPALATMKIIIPNAAQSQTSIAARGTINLDLERPVQLEVSVDRLRRLIALQRLIKQKLQTEVVRPLTPVKLKSKQLMHKFRGLMVLNSVESITIQTTQIAIVGLDGTCGWDSASFQVGAGGRPDRLVGRALVSALVLCADPPGDTRHMVLQPLTFGMELEASWEAWRKTEGISYREPMIRVTLELDRVTFDLRPTDMATVGRLNRKIKSLLNEEEEMLYETNLETASTSMSKNASASCVTFEDESTDSDTCAGADEHFYKDDLRSGAFKLVNGGQLPMAYQVTLHRDVVSWRYPHPRVITRLVAYPLPGQDKETPCVLELYNTQLNRWERHTYFSIPVGEPVQLCLYVPPPDAVFSVMWRYRACPSSDRDYAPFEFASNKFLPRSDPLYNEPPPETASVNDDSEVSAEQLSGVVRVDSCFSPRHTPRVTLVTRLAKLALHFHNSEPSIASHETYLEGYYVSRPLMRSHRVLTLAARDATVHAQLATPAGSLVLLQTDLSSDCLDCTTGTMERLVCQFHAECGLSLPTEAMSRARLSLSDVHVALQVPKVRTLNALLGDWREAVKFYHRTQTTNTDTPPDDISTKKEIADVTAAALEGRISLWVHNTCGSAIRVGQEGTDEVVPLGPGVSLAYRWRSPTAVKKLRFALAGPTADWHWSTSVAFKNVSGSNRVRLQDAEILLGDGHNSPGVYLYTKVEEIGCRRSLILSGRLCLANMLRYNLLYKVRARGHEGQWRSLYAGEISAESLGNTVICGADTDLAVKIKFSSSDTGWSGDIPLRECPKENVPWLVKVPCEGDTPFMSVWCRVVRARNDGRILATIWPLYVLYSHLPLDTDVLISTKTDQSSSEEEPSTSEPTPLIQNANGRGTCTHLLAPGTTAARHSLSFQYRSINCPVTLEAVPLHYGVTFTSVFEKRPSVATIEEVLQEVDDWLKRCSRAVVSGWPYSIVTKHWPSPWQPANMQPRCDVVVHYQAVRAGGGCSLEVQLCPVVLLCNAAPICLTLRAHDAAPLCKLEPGCAIAPPTAVLEKPFFISMEIGRETFVSGELSVSGAELGRYGATPHGRIALNRPAELTIVCSQKVALLTMYYEIKEDINILGLSTTYVLLNKMDTAISVSAVAVSNDTSEDTPLRPTTFKVVDPVSETNPHGKPLCRFMLVGRWRGSDPRELRLYLFVGLPEGGTPTRATPIRLGHPPVRRAIALTAPDESSVGVVVTQVYHGGRWVVTVGRDPCPQLVVHNRTSAPLAVAHPQTAHLHAEPTTSKITVQQECPGTRWNCVVPAGAVTHYSTPAYCLRYPPPNNAPLTNNTEFTFLTFAMAKDAGEMEWCVPVALTDGEQLLQLVGGMTVKLRVRTHPHSTHLELRDVDKRDISASDIRKRLLGPFSSENFGNEQSKYEELERTNADENLLSSSAYEEPVELNASNTKVKPDSTDDRLINQSLVMLLPDASEEQQRSRPNLVMSSEVAAEAANVFREVTDPEWDEKASWSGSNRLRIVAASVAVDLAQTSDTLPLVALHLDRPAVVVHADARRTKTSISVGDIQIDNLQYETGQFDFAVVATTRDGETPQENLTCLWNLFADFNNFSELEEKILLKLTHDSWKVLDYNYMELTEVEMKVGPVALYIEDAYVTSLARLWRRAMPQDTDSVALPDERALRRPLTLRLLHIHPLDLTLTLHTAVRMYIALDQSPLRLSAFKLQDTMTSPEWLTHALTVHYLSAAILGAGWVVGGLELLGAPGALAARVGGARGGVRGVASAAAAALLRSLSAWAGSLARNLDLLAGDEEHARRAAAARRRPPTSLMAGLATGITNFAINILGAVGGLAHHPLVGVAVGESDSSATALRRGILGALAKPLSATADLVAFAGHGLLTQTGWDPVPQPLCGGRHGRHESTLSTGWRRDCVRWSFRLAELSIFVGFQVLLDSTPLLLLLTHKYLVVTDLDYERIVEMIDFKFCSIGPFQGHVVELVISQKRLSRVMDTRADEDDEFQISAAAMARVARYTGAESAAPASEARVLTLVCAPRHAHALHAALSAAHHYNGNEHFNIL